MTANRVTSATMALLTLCVLAEPAAANVPETFTACIGPVRSDYCSTGDTYLAGDDLWFRGHVKPAHAGKVATAQMKEPGDDRWSDAGMATVSDRGKMRWTWRTDVADANIAFYRLRWKIPGHGNSEVATVQLVVPGD